MKMFRNDAVKAGFRILTPAAKSRYDRAIDDIVPVYNQPS